MKADGGAAFPRTGEGFGNPLYDAPGMTLRDWFAGQALAATANAEEYLNSNWPGNVAEDAYRIADAMLAEREKGGDEG